MPRILVAECIHEICSFNPVPTRYADFAVMAGAAMFAYHRGVGSEVGGALQVFDDANVDAISTYAARGITSGGTIAAADFNRLAGEFLDALRKAPAADAVYFALHGAMAADNEADPEGYLLAEARKIVGNKIPLVASFDLHGILTDRMLEHTDAIVLYHTYPHVDFFETGQRAARLLLRILAGEVKPVTARVFIPALVRGDELITRTGVYGQFIRDAAAIEQSLGGLSAGMFIGNPFTDVPELGCNAVVVTDNDPARAERQAIRLATEFWEQRAHMQARLTSLDEAVQCAVVARSPDRATASTEGPSAPPGDLRSDKWHGQETVPQRKAGTVILMDAADATSSGASGDSNAILRKLLDVGYAGKALIPIVDPGAVEAAFASGIGSTLQTTVGGAFDKKRFQPLPISAKVRMLSDGRFRSESFGQEWYGGRTAVLQSGNVVLVVTSRPVHLYDRSLFYAHGQDPRHFDLVVVKSPHCQPHMFADWCGRLINVDAAGSTSANLPTLGHTRCARPIFPLERETSFSPKAKIFRRFS